MSKADKKRRVTLTPRGNPSPRQKELEEDLAAIEAAGPPDDDGKPRPSLRDAIELELPYAVSRRVLVNVYSKLYGVSTRTVDRAIALAKDAYAEAMATPKAQLLAEGKAFMRVVQNRALRSGRTADAIAAKRYELELAGATMPGALDPEGTAHAPITPEETRAIILARLAAKAQPKGT